MRASLIAIATLLLYASPLAAQETAPPDSELPSGTRVRYWSHVIAPEKWHEAVLMRLFPPGQVCLALASDELKGATTLGAVDSLQIDRSGWHQVPGSLLPGPPPVWESVSPKALHAREHCTH